MKPKYQRVIIKMSGEALAGNDRFGLNNDVLSAISDQIIQAKETGCEICVVVGGGNFGVADKAPIWIEQRQIIWGCWQQP